MSRLYNAASRSDSEYGNPVRRDAYERGMQLLNGRAASADRLSADQREIVRTFEGPEVVGDRSRLPPRRYTDAS